MHTTAVNTNTSTKLYSQMITRKSSVDKTLFWRLGGHVFTKTHSFSIAQKRRFVVSRTEVCTTRVIPTQSSVSFLLSAKKPGRILVLYDTRAHQMLVGKHSSCDAPVSTSTQLFLWRSLVTFFTRSCVPPAQLAPCLSHSDSAVPELDDEREVEVGFFDRGALQGQSGRAVRDVCAACPPALGAAFRFLGVCMHAMSYIRRNKYLVLPAHTHTHASMLKLAFLLSPPI